MQDINDDEPEVTWDDVKPESPAYQKGMVAAEECDALRHLAWPRDLRDMQHAMGLFKKPETYDDYRYAFHLLGEVAERLREARDFPEKRILRRWQDVQFAVAVSAGHDRDYILPFLKTAAQDFAVVPPPEDKSDLLAVATWTMASLLDVLTSDPEKFAGVQKAIKTKFIEMFPGVRRGRIVNGQLVLDPEPQVIPFPRASDDDEIKGRADDPEGRL